ncbi:hypothetical protein AX16_007462 [Volvariella volvacea WC 439]|nr:hypothetical protein AX16_007462 [Volvariella volvacea WC 439]
MQSLLRWAIENSTPGESAPQPAGESRNLKNLDPGIIDMLLGKPDAVLMKESLDAALDTARSEEARVDALDQLEMLIEQIDNANNLEKLKMWQPLQNLLTAETSTPDIKMHALWVIGTALQNNPAAQDAYMAYKPLPTLISFLTSSPSSTLKTRSRALYTISGLLKHNAPAVEALSDPDVHGWEKLKESLQDPEIAVRRKTIFLFSTLLTPTAPHTIASSLSSANLHTPDTPNDQNQPVHPNSHAVHLTNPERVVTSNLTLKAIEKYGILDAIISSLVNPLPYGEDGEMEGPDVDFEEKTVQLLHNYALTCDGPLSPTQKKDLKSFFDSEISKSSEETLLERWGLASSDFKALLARVA